MTMESTAVVTDLSDLGTIRQAAERVMPPAYRDFVNNADVERTLTDDIAAWSALRLRPRALVDVSHVDTSVTLLGQPVSMPIVTAPFIGSTLVHPDGEVATARGALAAGTITTLSMNGTRTPEQVGAVAAGRLTVLVVPRRNDTCIGTSPAPANEAGSVNVMMSKPGISRFG